MFYKLVKQLTGARTGENRLTFLSFFSLFFLLLSYYLVKPLRDSLFLTHYGAEMLPYFFLATPVLAFGVTKLFNAFVGRVNRYKLMVTTYAITMACMLFFWILLPLVGRWATAVFYLWGSVYFILVLPVLWGVINTIFASEQAERTFGFVALGATVGNIVGGQLSSSLSQSDFKDAALFLSAIAMAAALGLILLATRFGTQAAAAKEHPTGQQATTAKVVRGMDDVLEIFKNRYVRGIAMMVASMALIGSVFNLQIYAQINDTLSARTYAQTFQWLPAADSHLETVRTYKKLSEPERDKAMQELLLKTQLPASEKAHLQQSYKQYQEQLEASTRKVFSDVSTWQGVLGVFLLVVVSRFLFRSVGLRWTVLLLPAFYLLSSGALFFPLELLGLQIIMVLANALNYSLNNATKELLYTPTTEMVRFQLKPLIEGPFMRVGDVSASVLQLFMTFVAGGSLAIGVQTQNRLMLGIGMLMVVGWMLLIWQTGSRYDANQLAEPRSQALDQET